MTAFSPIHPAAQSIERRARIDHALAMCAENDLVLRRTSKIVDRLLPSVPAPPINLMPYPSHVERWWERQVAFEARKMERQRLFGEIRPRIAAKVRGGGGMIVLRSTMLAAVAEARETGWQRVCRLTEQYGHALVQVNALQRQLAAWVRNEPGDITPEQMADMFYAQDDRWQAKFFNAMQTRVLAHHESQPKPEPGAFGGYAGVPAGEAQWWHMAQHLDRSGFETIEAMFDHAKSAREREQAA